ncbi:hypothetical protein RAS1_11320 [Phycisphaerae bacterium RAS1]|nr:hypothetical protein RAS1_11320 [Phycisphaerae bacterium RAS1]
MHSFRARCPRLVGATLTGVLTLATLLAARAGLAQTVPTDPRETTAASAEEAALLAGAASDDPRIIGADAVTGGGVLLGSCVNCQPCDRIEDEPLCANGYVDNFNGGCNSTPNVFGNILCGQTVCGQYGTYVSGGGSNFRDTDWYRFSIPERSAVTFSAVGEATTRIFILTNACPTATIATATAPPCGTATINVTLEPGTYIAFVGTDVFTGVPCGSLYRATLICDSICRVENEPVCANGYVDNFNGGCNSTPNVFGGVQCGDTICGEYGTFLSAGGANFRDTDWYRFGLSRRTTVTWTVVGNATTRAFILQGTCPAVSLGTAVAAAGMPATVTLTLEPGLYNAFAGTDVFTGVPCGTTYQATLTCEEICRVEGEPDCANGYVDNFNGGCNSTPPVFGTVQCGDRVCGKYGTFVSAGGSNFRDTDWYTFSLTQRTAITWRAMGGATTRVFVLNSNCPAASLGTAVAPAGETASVSLTLEPGTYRGFVGTDVFTGVPCGTTYEAELVCDEICRVENEPECANGYVDNFNGGCNSTPPVFGAVECGQTVCGEYGTFLSAGGSNFRDTDWYTFVLGGAGAVTWSATGTATTRVFILNTNCPATSLGTAAAPAGMPATVTLNLTPGTYRAFVGTDVFTGVACGSTYTATLTCPPDCGAPICGDSNCDGAFNVLDINFFVQAILGEANWDALPGTYCDYCRANDIDGDGEITVLDINFFVNGLLAGYCPPSEGCRDQTAAQPVIGGEPDDGASWSASEE